MGNFGLELRKTGLDLRKHWRCPSQGNYVSNSELASYSIGGLGVKTVNAMLSQIALAPTCVLIGTVYKLSPSNIMILFIITNIISVLKTPLVSMLVDNTNTKIGKFRPYLLWAGIPSVIGVLALVWFVPMEAAPLTKMILIGVFYNLLAISQPLYNNGYMGISQVISPLSAERTKIMSISEFIANLGPSIVSFLFPILAALCFGEMGLENIMAYRIFLPIFAISGFLLGLLVIVSTNERIIVSKEITKKVKFFDGIKQISGNKYFWLVTVSKFFDGFKAGLGMLITWICLYQLGSSSMAGIIPTIVSLAFIPGMLLAPICMKRFGARKFGFFSNALNCVFAILMFVTFKKGVVFFAIALFLYNFASGPQYVTQTTILSDGLDYQQDKKGERIEGFAQNFMLMITTVGTILSTIIFTGIYENYGLKADPITGQTDYKILVDAAIREPIISGVIIVVAIACILSALPYLFCDMTPKKHNAIINSLEKKKFYADHLNNDLSEEQIASLYNEFLAEKEAKNLEVQKSKDMEKEDREELKRQGKKLKADYILKLKNDGLNDKEVKKKIKMEIDTDYENRKADFEKLYKEEMKLIKENKLRRAPFVAARVEEMKMQGKKGIMLKFEATEEFYQMLLKEEAEKQALDKENENKN